MLDYNKQVKDIYSFLERAENQQTYPYAYEIYLLQPGLERMALISRTSGTEKFYDDIDYAIDRAKQINGKLRIEIYSGKSHNAKKIDSFTLQIASQPLPDNFEEGQSNNALGSLLGILADNKGGQNIEGLLGLFNTFSGTNKELERVNFQKQLDEFRWETRFESLQEKFEKLNLEHDGLRQENERYSSENKELQRDNAELEQRLAAYAPGELVKRVAVGVLSGIGGKILGNSPKTAELFGLTPQELKGALGIVDETDESTLNKVAERSVEVTEIGASQTPEDEKKAEIINSISNALVELELEEVAKLANIVGVCLDKPGLSDRTLVYISKALQNLDETVNQEEKAAI